MFTPSAQVNEEATAVEKEISRGQTKSYTTILEQQIEEALAELQRPKLGLFISGFSGGMDLGFSVLVLAILLTTAGGVWSEPVLEILRANAYTLGFILVIFGRSALFTEHTTLAVLPVLGESATLRQLGRLWGIVYASNLIGAATFALLVVGIGPSLGIIDLAVFGELAHEVADYPWFVIVASGVLAGWLMGLASWLVTAGRDTVSEVIFVWLVTGSIGYAHLHHCILGSVELLAALFAGTGVTLWTYAYFLTFATLGNVLGGVFFVAVLKYGHATRVRRGMRHELVELARHHREDRARG